MSGLVRFVYTLLLVAFSPLLLWVLYRAKSNKPKFGQRWKEHFGFTPKLGNQRKGVIWVHAVSVGEVLASKGLVNRLAKQYPDKQLLVTTTTSTGAEQVSKMGSHVTHRYMPIDFSWCVRRFVNVVKPDALLIIETELWPNTIHTVSSINIPIILVNGRLSQKSFLNYRKLSLLISPVLQKLSTIMTVHADDANRFRQLGISGKKVIDTGSIKYDVSLDEEVYLQGLKLRAKLGDNRKVLIAASTHLGEDEKVLAAFKAAKLEYPELLLVLVPRHPERFDSVAELVKNQQLSLVRRSSGSLDRLPEGTDVYLGDTMGEMIKYLAASDLVFMGGSLIGDKVGGHNFVEPAMLSKLTITGPSYYNFADLGKQLIAAGALEVVEDEEQLASKVIEYFSSPLKLEQGGKEALSVVEQNQGALQRSVDIINRVIESAK
ncbi:3-deoxy-D-manno-octulosonic acid transferase [Vibrio sp. JPW-9-11-11]|uniref:lipid IV(A) 3-deoxy-D-manno-octulosonic acid transferase n=1 Tax=Vibrio sp. JPW-9-11-11 TaxID=1416532 RepID=UPI001593258B|nr:lipid IV(A) 3-deoxy-D-manno-octulosonic acid transferase [Vibrio sp. JPW-9-11-11]NVD05363.1 3-deoxy-D-manno-octulosonic acid transferase [Vibrio sp. JPW-9-11-11]